MKPLLTITSNDKPVSIYCIQTGSVTMKTKAHTGRFGAFPLRVLDIMFDKNFIEWRPIYVWVIDHPEGVYVIDTGATTRVNDFNIYNKAGWLRKWFAKTQVKTTITREEEIDMQLRRIGFDISKVKAVIMTHTHLEHTDGLKYFKGNKIIVNEYEWSKRDLAYLI